MNWKLKSGMLCALSGIPFGGRVYHLGQRWLGTNRIDPLESVRRALDLVELLSEAGRSPRDARYLEIGTGWRPFVPIVLYLSGARGGISVDVNPWLTYDYAAQTCVEVGGHLSMIADKSRTELEEVARRYESLRTAAASLQGILDAARIDYRCPSDASATGIDAASLDLVCSSNVLEHVAPDVLMGMHREAARLLRPGGVIAHRFNPQDHASHVDRSVTGANFVQYSNAAWRFLGGGRLGYHNRLRCVEHRRLIESAGFRVLVDRRRVDERAERAIESGRLRVADQFAAFSPRELAEDYMWVVAETATSVATPLVEGDGR